MNKKAFTIIEILITITIISIIFGISAFTYQHAQQKTKTDQNYYHANEVIQAVERFKGINTGGSRYPTVNNLSSPTDFADFDQGFKDLLSSETKKRLTFATADFDQDKKKIRFETCIRNDQPVGVQVFYWDLIDNTAKQLNSGKTSGSDVTCYNY